MGGGIECVCVGGRRSEGRGGEGGGGEGEREWGVPASPRRGPGGHDGLGACLTLTLEGGMTGGVKAL